MGLLKGNFTFTRFHVDDKLPQEFLNFVNSRIKTNAFRQMSKSTEEKQLGWVSLTDVLDTDFEQANYALADYLVFCLRIDRKLIPSNLMKLKLMTEERRYLTESAGSGRINKQTATAIKDKVKLELMTKLDPVPSFYDVCWAIGKNTIYFSSLADTVADDFVELFKKTFSLNLKRFLPQENPHPAKNGESTESVSFIGREFLTWLWFKSEERNGRIALTDSEEVELHFIKRIVLESGEGEYSQGVVCSGIHAELKEGKEAIRQGKKVKEAVIKLNYNQNEWEFTFKADSFQFQSLSLPGIFPRETPEDPAGSLLERIYLIETAVKTMDNLFDSFLRIRYLPQWEERELKSLAGWLKR